MQRSEPHWLPSSPPPAARPPIKPSGSRTAPRAPATTHPTPLKPSSHGARSGSPSGRVHQERVTIIHAIHTVYCPWPWPSRFTRLSVRPPPPPSPSRSMPPLLSLKGPGDIALPGLTTIGLATKAVCACRHLCLSMFPTAASPMGPMGTPQVSSCLVRAVSFTHAAHAPTVFVPFCRPCFLGPSRQTIARALPAKPCSIAIWPSVS